MIAFKISIKEPSFKISLVKVDITIPNGKWIYDVPVMTNLNMSAKLEELLIKEDAPNTLQSMEKGSFRFFPITKPNGSVRVNVYVNLDEICQLPVHTLRAVGVAFQYTLGFYGRKVKPSSFFIDFPVSKELKAYKLEPKREKVVSWMQSVEADSIVAKHSMTELEGHLAIKSNPKSVIDFVEGVGLPHICGRIDDTLAYVYGGLLFINEKSLDWRQSMLPLIKLGALEDFNGLFMTDTQEPFLLPSLATVIHVASLKTYNAWLNVLKGFPGKVLLVDSPDTTKYSFLEIIFADIILLFSTSRSERYIIFSILSLVSTKCPSSAEDACFLLPMTLTTTPALM
jgi:hypothetical protein